MITLSNGHKMEYVAASGALGYFGEGWPWDKLFIWTGQLDPRLFTVVGKTLTYKPRKGNLRWYWPFGCIRFLNKGTLNAVGLTNPGIEWWGDKVWQGKGSGLSLIVSIFSENIDTPQELASMACLVGDLPIVGIEINASCPNTEGDILENTRKIVESCEKVKKVTKHPLLLKLSVVHNIGEILPEIKGIIEAISINSVPWKVIFPNKKSPLAHLGGGGVSGKIAQSYTWAFVEQLADKTDIPVIGPSVWEYEDIQKLRKLGAKAISFGSIFLHYPWRPGQFVRKDMR